MKVLLFSVIIACSLAIYSAKYANEAGHCEAFTVDFIATLITRKIRQVLDTTNFGPRNIRFDLYTRKNPYERQRLAAGDLKALRRSNFNPAWPTRFTLHGWHGQTTTCSNAAIKDAYLYRGDFNVFLVDWSDYSLDINYIRVVNEMWEMGKMFNDFTRFLHDQTGAQFKDMYLIGHSAGCHIAGIAGKLLKPDKYGVIFALDSAGPVHRNFHPSQRLTPDDAMYVESIQTDIMSFGYASDTLAHASFYPNWGLGQPQCPNSTAMEPDFLCDHFSSLYYFVESIINPQAFGAIRCKTFRKMMQRKCSCGKRAPEMCPAENYMGGEPAVPKRGVYYLSTKSAKPFGFGENCLMKKPIMPYVLRR